VEIRDRIRELRRVKAADLLPNPKNWRRHPKAQADALRGLLAEVGYADALIARELPGGKLMLIDGHLRAETTPTTEVPVLVLDVNEAEADKILLTLDPLASMAEADVDRIKALLGTIQTDSDAVRDLLRDTAGAKAWESVPPSEIVEAFVSPDRADELRRKWGTQAGPVWAIDRHRIACGSSTDKAHVARLWATGGPKLRMIWTDPPYGVSYGQKTAWMEEHGSQKARRSIANDSLKPEEVQALFAAVLAAVCDRAEPGAAIYATAPSVYLKYFIQAMENGGFSYKHQLVWIKQSLVMGRSDYHYRHEPILYGWLETGAHYFTDDRTQDSVFEVDRPIVSELHPTMKPVELVAKMVANSSRPGELVYDPFCGSGSTILAAHQLGRIGYGSELDPGYVAVELERLTLLGLKPELVSQ
jgi:DNA modification methylase